jgi:uncharacterized membrane protein YccC
MISILNPIIPKDNPLTIKHSARMAIAAVVSLLVARWFGLSESCWVAITTLVVMLIHSRRGASDLLLKGIAEKSDLHPQLG